MYNSHGFFFDTEMSLLVAKLFNVRLRQMSENYFNTTSVSEQLSLVTPSIGQKIMFDSFHFDILVFSCFGHFVTKLSVF